MPSLTLESATDVLDLDSIAKTGRGVQVTSGVTGLGLPAKQVQWLEGAGDGSTYRGRRTLARDMDLPLYILGTDTADLRRWLSRLSRMLRQPAKLTFLDSEGASWTTTVTHTGGGDFTYGVDTIGDTDFATVITLRAGDPYFTSTIPTQKDIKGATASRGLIGKLSQLQLASSQRIGSIQLENIGDVEAWPTWVVYGPGDTFRAVSPAGQAFQWNGTLTKDDVLTIDTKAGTVVDQNGVNRYDSLAPAPRFWPVPPLTSTSQCSLLNVTTASAISCSFYPRRELVI